MTVPALRPESSDLVPDTLEAVGLELSLQNSQPPEFAAALEEAGARLLFCLNDGADPDAPFVAAVAIGEGAQRQFLIVTRPSDGAVSVEPASTSTSPVARLAPSFVAVMERWPAVAEA